MKLYKLAKRISYRARYPFSLGFADGLGLLLKTWFNEVVHFQPKGMKAPLMIRAKTSDLLVFEHVFVTSETKMLIDRIGNPSVIIDAGANIGLTTASFAAAFPQAKIIAIEPQQDNFDILCKNVAAYPNVICLKAALWHTNTRLQLHDPGRSHYSFQVGEVIDPNEDGTVEALTVPELIDRFQLGKIDFLKVDIEGAEKEVFENGAEAWLPKVSSLAVELHERMKPGCGYAFFNAACSRKFKYYGMGEKIVLVFE